MKTILSLKRFFGLLIIGGSLLLSAGVASAQTYRHDYRWEQQHRRIEQQRILERRRLERLRWERERQHREWLRRHRHH